jgi:hypothetical protein
VSEAVIKRKTRVVSFSLSDTLSGSSAIRADDMAGGVLSVGTVSTNAASVQIFCSQTIDGEYRRLRATDGVAADITLSPSTTLGSVYSLPDSAFSVPFMKIVGGNTHSNGVPAILLMKS